MPEKDARKEALLDSSFTSMTPEQIVEQMVLEALLENTHEEIPFIAAISCESITKISDARVSVKCIIEVDTPAQARIVVGQGARTLVRIRQTACAILRSFRLGQSCPRLQFRTTVSCKICRPSSHFSVEFPKQFFRHSDTSFHCLVFSRC